MGGPNCLAAPKSCAEQVIPRSSEESLRSTEQGSLLWELFELQQAAFEVKLQRHHADLAKIIREGQRSLEETLVNRHAHHTVPLGNVSQSKTVTKVSHPAIPPSDDPKAVQPRQAFGASEDIATVETQKHGKTDTPEQSSSADSRTLRKAKTGIVKKLGTSENLGEDLSDTCHNKARELLEGKVGVFTSMCIVANIITMFVQLHYLGELANESLGLDHNDWPGAVTVFQAIECVFAAIFLAELLLTLYVYHCSFFRGSAFNTVDAVIVIVTSVEMFILTPLASNITNLSFLRILRFARFARAFKVVRTMKLFESLRVLVATILYSISSMFWAMTVMFILMLTCSIFLCQALHESIVNESLDLDVRLWINKKYGTGSKALYTLFEMTFSGCWPNFVSPVVMDVSPWYAVFFIVYVTFVVFAMIRIISALFLKETLAQASRDAEMMVRERSKKTARLSKELSELFDSADKSGDGMVSQEELHNLLKLPKVKLWMTELGVNAEDSDHLFELLDTGDGAVSHEEFVRGVSKLKGEARAQDLVPVVADCKRILQLCRSLQHQFDEISNKLGPPLISFEGGSFPQ